MSRPEDVIHADSALHKTGKSGVTDSRLTVGVELEFEIWKRILQRKGGERTHCTTERVACGMDKNQANRQNEGTTHQ